MVKLSKKSFQKGDIKNVAKALNCWLPNKSLTPTQVLKAVTKYSVS